MSQALFVVLQQSVTTLMEDSQSVVTEILDLIISTYRIHPQPAALDLSKTVITINYNNDNNKYLL